MASSDNHPEVYSVSSSPDDSSPYPIPPAKPPQNPGLFQRLWTDEDEINLLRGFLRYTTNHGWLNSSQHHDTSAFYSEIKPKLNLDFNKSQLVEKLRRLKKKFRTTAAKVGDGGERFHFKTEHDKVSFEISRKIWTVGSDHHNPNPSPSNRIPKIISISTTMPSPNSIESRKRPRVLPVEPVVLVANPSSIGFNNIDVNYSRVLEIEPISMANSTHFSFSGLIEESVKVCATPIVKELVNRIRSGGFDEVAPPLGFDEKWRKQQILELEVYSKRIKLMQDDIQSALQELSSKGL